MIYQIYIPTLTQTEIRQVAVSAKLLAKSTGEVIIFKYNNIGFMVTFETNVRDLINFYEKTSDFDDDMLYGPTFDTSNIATTWKTPNIRKLLNGTQIIETSPINECIKSLILAL